MNSGAVRVWALTAVSVGVFTYAAIPVIVQLFSDGSDPVMFAAVQIFTQAALLMTASAIMWPRVRAGMCKALGLTPVRASAEMRRALTDWDAHSSGYKRTSGGGGAVIVNRSSGPSFLLRNPFVWCTVTALDWFMMSLGRVVSEVAVVSSMSSIWPVLLVLMLYRHANSVAAAQGVPLSRREYRPGFRALSAVFLAMAGMGLLAVSQSESSLVGWSSVPGVLLGTVSAVSIAITITMSLSHTEFVYKSAMGLDPADSGGSLLVFVWISTTLLAIARLLGSMVYGLAGLLSSAEIGVPAMTAAVSAGVLLAVGSVILRVVNVDVANARVSNLFVLSPVIALTALMAVGTDTPRPAMLIMGGTVLMALAATAQLRPATLGLPAPQP